MTSSDTETRIRDQIGKNSILLYMKGTPEAPECGFSGAAVAAIKKTGFAFSFVNVLANPFIRERLPRVSKWPTFPQLFVQGELIGGADIIVEMQGDGSLQQLLEAVPDAKRATAPEAKSAPEVKREGGDDLSLPVLQ